MGAPPRIPQDRRWQGRSNMPQWRVRDAMTTDVITAPDDASIAEIVAVLTDRQITAVPIVDRLDVVLGVVSWTDQLTFDPDDTVAAAPARQAVEHDPLLGWRIGSFPARSADAAPGDRAIDHDVQTETRSAAPQ
jgi:hypothetical protein